MWFEKAKDGLFHVKNQVEEFLYPSTCIVCGNFSDGKLTCTKCKDKIEETKPPKCMKCGKHIGDGSKEYCMDCQRKHHYFDKGIGAFSYNDYLRKSIYDFKYYGVKNLGRLYGEEIAKRYKYEILSWEADCLIPVPIHYKKERQRGYNQAELLADAIGKELDIPVINDLIVRNINTKPQKELNDIERHKNLEKAFLITQNVVKLKKIIIVDDIYTTGATIDACAKVLKEAGCAKVYYISVCIGVGI